MERRSRGNAEERARAGLSDSVVNLEMTLISVIQATILFFLIDVSAEPLLELRFELWPYIGAGLLFILIFWSRALVHTITIIRWPLDFTHDFLYIALALLHSVMFLQLESPLHWQLMGAA